MNIYQDLYLIACKCKNDQDLYYEIESYLKYGKVVPIEEIPLTQSLLTKYYEILENNKELLFSSIKKIPFDYGEVEFFDNYFKGKSKNNAFIKDNNTHMHIYQDLHSIASQCKSDKELYYEIKSFLLRGKEVPLREKPIVDFLYTKYYEILEGNEKLLFSSLKIFPIDYREVDFFDRLFKNKPKIFTLNAFQYYKIVEYGRYYVLTKEMGGYSVLLFGILEKFETFPTQKKMTKPQKLNYWMQFLEIPLEKWLVNNDLINDDPIEHLDALPKVKELYALFSELELTIILEYFEQKMKENRKLRAHIKGVNRD